MGYARLAETGGLQWPSTDARPDGTVRLYTDRAFPTAWTVSESFEKDIDTGHEHTMREYRKRKAPSQSSSIRPQGLRTIARLDRRRVSDGRDDRPAGVSLADTVEERAIAMAPRGRSRRVPLANSRDAKRLGIADGDTIRVVSRRGSVVAPAKVGEVVPPGSSSCHFITARSAKATPRIA